MTKIKLTENFSDQNPRTKNSPVHGNPNFNRVYTLEVFV